VALLKRGELLGQPEEVNQQPSCASNQKMRGTEGSETRRHAKVGRPRGPWVRKRMADHIAKTHYDIVRTAVVQKEAAEA